MPNNSHRLNAAYCKLEGIDNSFKKLIRYAKRVNKKMKCAAITVTLCENRIFVYCLHLGLASEVWHNHSSLRGQLVIWYGNQVQYTPLRAIVAKW